MAIKYTIEKHTVAFPSKVRSMTAGHILNILLEEDRDNGSIVAQGDFVDIDLYKAKASTGVEGVVRCQLPNKNWLVEITEPGDGIFLRNVPMSAEDWTKRWQDEANFYNANGDVVLGYTLSKYDCVEVSAEGFDTTPEAGKKVTVEDYKFKIADD